MGLTRFAQTACDGENASLLGPGHSHSSSSSGGSSVDVKLVIDCPEKAALASVNSSGKSNKDVGQSIRLETILALPRRVSHWVWNTGEACMLLAALMFSFATMMLKLTGGRVSVLEVSFLRCLISVVLSVLMGWRMGMLRGWRILGTSRRWGLLTMRGIFGGCSMICGYVAIWRLPISVAVVIGQLNPPVTALAAYIFLKEPLGIRGTVGVVMAFCGVVVISQPPIPGISSGHQEWGLNFAIGAGAGVIAAVLAAGAYMCIRKLTSESSLVLGLWFHSATVVICLVPVSIGWPDKTVLPSAGDAGLVLAVSVLGFFALIIFTRSFQLLSAGKASALNFTGVLYAYTWDLLIWGTRITLVGILGTVLTLAGVMLVAIRNSKAAAAARTSPGKSTPSRHIKSAGGCPKCNISRHGSAPGLYSDVESAPLLDVLNNSNSSSNADIRPVSPLALESGADGGLPLFMRSVNLKHGARPHANAVLNPLLVSGGSFAHPGLETTPSFAAWAQQHPIEPESGPSAQTTGSGDSGDSALVRTCTYCGDEGFISLANSVGAVREAATSSLRRSPSCPIFGSSPAPLVGHEVHF